MRLGEGNSELEFWAGCHVSTQHSKNTRLIKNNGVKKKLSAVCEIRNGLGPQQDWSSMKGVQVTL